MHNTRKRPAMTVPESAALTDSDEEILKLSQQYFVMSPKELQSIGGLAAWTDSDEELLMLSQRHFEASDPLQQAMGRPAPWLRTAKRWKESS